MSELHHPEEPEYWRREAPHYDSKTCPWCAGGYLRLVSSRTGQALHELPEPGGMHQCEHVDTEDAPLNWGTMGAALAIGFIFGILFLAGGGKP